MKAKDLRIGNLVKWKQTGHQWVIGDVIALPNPDVEDWSIEVNGPDGVCELSPIPLTEEWLIKFGFERYKEKLACQIYKHSDNNKFEVYKMIGDYPFRFNNQVFDIKIKYVHQMQNLYHALTGEELVLINQ